MSTRAYIRIKKKGESTVHFHHHCDGYPSGVGADLVNLLKQYNGEWSPEKLGAFINKEDDDFEFINNGPSWDHEYIYLVDCDEKELTGYHKGITAMEENQEDYFLYTDKLFIEGNIFDGRKIEMPSCASENMDWSSFRREAAKDILPAVIAKKSSMCSYDEMVKEAIEFTDELIKQLKEDEK